MISGPAIAVWPICETSLSMFLKIDRSFIKTIQHREQDRKIVGSIIELARALDMTLVVEGVEKEEQGCHSRKSWLRPCAGVSVCSCLANS